jgi:hypothetical protein
MMCNYRPWHGNKAKETLRPYLGGVLRTPPGTVPGKTHVERSLEKSNLTLL